MKQTSGSAVGKKALIKRPPMAVVSQGDGHARADGPGSAQASYGPALIDDHTPTPEHARFSRSPSQVGHSSLTM